MGAANPGLAASTAMRSLPASKYIFNGSGSRLRLLRQAMVRDTEHTLRLHIIAIHQYYNCLLAHKASRSWGVRSAEPAHWGSEYYLEYYSDAGANKCPVDRYVEYGSLKERLARCYAAWDGGGEVAEGFPYWPWSMSA